MELRVLGSLLEKQRSTPDAYPLTLNSLRLACNQATNRDPVTDYDEGAIREALARLSRRGWVRLASGAGSRAAKYRHLVDEKLGLSVPEQAIVSVLLLRGPQTPGELKQRSERAHRFSELDDVERTLDGLIARGLARRLGRRPGQKEDRFAHALSDEETEAPEEPRAPRALLEEVPEAPLRRGEAGLIPAGEGWFIVNIAEAEGIHTDDYGDACTFETREQRFPEFGINVHVLQPGQPNSLYHRENAQEAFLVVSGECLAIVEEQERRMRAGDFLHCPPGTAHVLVGAGDGPCAIVMVGTRKSPEELLYPVSEAAGRHGGSVEEETDSARTAYAGSPPPEPARLERPW